MNSIPDPDEPVRDFYERFTRARMGSYREGGNLRIERAIHRLLPYLTPSSVVLEIGCGVGLVSQAIAQRLAQGSLWACDISQEAIEAATQSVKAPEAHFRRFDVVRDFADLKAWIGGRVQVILMVDVLEHIPRQEHSRLFRNLRSVLEDEATLILTFPSPRYQEYLSREKPDELQIVDETIELPDLLHLAAANGLAIRHYSLEDMWLNNQYVHCVLQTAAKSRLGREGESLNALRQEIEAFVPEGGAFILADEAKWALGFQGGRCAIPFTEKDGQYWGPPADDEAAIAELERLRARGFAFAVFGSPAFWWLEHYMGLRKHLESNFRRVYQNDRVIIFDLRFTEGAPTIREQGG